MRQLELGRFAIRRLTPLRRWRRWAKHRYASVAEAAMAAKAWAETEDPPTGLEQLAVFDLESGSIVATVEDLLEQEKVRARDGQVQELQSGGRVDRDAAERQEDDLRRGDPGDGGASGRG